MYIQKYSNQIENPLLYNQKCASHYNNNQFSILSKAKFDFITFLKPKLCT